MITKYSLVHRLVWILFLFGVLCSPALRSQIVPETQSESRFTGSNLKSEDVLLKVSAIFIGKITQIGFANTKMEGVLIYRNVQINVLRILRGSLDAKSTFRLDVVPLTGFREISPVAGNSYIFFVKRNYEGEPDPFIVVKLLPATDNNIARVKALIAAAPASQ